MSTAPPREPRTQLDPREQQLVLTVRAALIMVLGALDDFLGLERSYETRKERKEREKMPVS